MEGGDSSLYNVWVTSLRLRQTDLKTEVPRFQLWFPINLNPVPQPLQPLPLTYEPVPPWDCRFHWFPFFPNTGDFMEYQTRSTLYNRTHPNVNQTERKLGQLWLVAGFIVLHSPSSCLVVSCCYQPCQPSIYPYQHSWWQLVILPEILPGYLSKLPSSSTSLRHVCKVYTNTDDSANKLTTITIQKFKLLLMLQLALWL